MPITIAGANKQLGSNVEIEQALNDGLSVRVGPADTWTYPRRSGRDGRIGKLSVSRCRVVPVAGANKHLAVHLTFGIQNIFVPSSTGVDRRPNPEHIRVDIRNLHFTARPEDVQWDISHDNFVANSPQNRDLATHRGELNDWLHVGTGSVPRERARNIAEYLGLPVANDDDITASRNAINLAIAAYTGLALTGLKNSIRDALQAEINDNLMPRERRGGVGIDVNFG